MGGGRAVGGGAAGGEIEFIGRKWFGYGNAALLDLPVVEPFRCSRKWAEDGPEMARQPTRKELYDRCHEMGDVVLEGLSRP